MSSAIFTVESVMAERYGLSEALMIGRMQVWIRNNAHNRRNQHEGRTWTYNTRKALSDEFPFWSESQIKRILHSLVDVGVLVQGEFNKNPYDRTAWYAFADETAFLGFESIDETESSPQEDEVVLSTGRSRPLLPTINPTINHTSSSSRNAGNEREERTQPRLEPSATVSLSQATASLWVGRLQEAIQLSDGTASMALGGTCHPKAFRQLCEPATGIPCDWDLDVIPAIQAKAASCKARGQQLSNWDWVKEGALRNRDQRLAGLPAVAAPTAQPMRTSNRKETNAERVARISARMKARDEAEVTA